ncbi:NRDE family protein [Lutibacter holmesii]|uniref:NRDE family protein n=1 Tax=Lutibacter holmesii TaxID=1137985 RepID=A0ABW3WM97_9FLAO
MCTVTFLPLAKNGFILTSSRDESPLRETIAPNNYVENGVKMCFPKDKLAGGTWIGTSSKKRLVCVLNGAFENHIKKDNYSKSRGVIAKEILKEKNAIEFIKNINLEGVEPFTLVLVDWSNEVGLYELIWDEKTKFFSKLKNEPNIWSSSTLYSNKIKELRKNWFQNWLAKNTFSTKTILEFHHSEIGDKQQSVLMKRSTVETVSITSVKKEGAVIEMNYNDVIHSKNTTLVV